MEAIRPEAPLIRSPYRGHGLGEWLERPQDAEEGAGDAWLVFDNTAEGEGTADPLEAPERSRS